MYDEIENIIVGLYDIVCENRELRSENKKLKEYKELYKKKINNDYVESRNTVANLLNSFGNIKTNIDKKDFEYE